MGCGCGTVSQVKPEEARKDIWCSPVPFSSPADVELVGGGRFHDLYILGPKIGRGSFGMVHRTILKTDRKEAKAVKVIKHGCGDGESEAGLLRQLRHANIIRFYDAHEECDFLFIVMELCFGGHLLQRFQEHGTFNEKDTACLGHQMLSAVEYIHDMGIVHRDIKAENFMLAQEPITSQVKLIDFGLASRIMDGQFLTVPCGSSRYMAPEVIAAGRYRCEVDLWAVGFLLYLLLFGQYVHDGKTDAEILMLVVHNQIRWHNTVTSVCLDFLQRLLNCNPWKRSSATQALGHPWLAVGHAWVAKLERDLASKASASSSACSSPCVDAEHGVQNSHR
eukprot:TRINITY_DN48425_c0_g1_i1.p1 TRINITY_DN48425_c0_g1~~TRINITY_DN48425_c0_g1_i1.p1  ORF type:complete len:348 (+),score=43.06 TRINITY_DN48425_c0_g1_i1:40-1044(+)